MATDNINSNSSKGHFKESLIAGLAIFSMFFGSGNIIFPLEVGKVAQDQLTFAFLGLFISAVLLPFMGVVVMIIFEGSYHRFFGSLGKIPGTIIMSIILAMIGPFGVIPRCVAIAHSTLKTVVPNLSIAPFSIIFCAIVYVLAVKRGKIIDILGKYLTPILLVSLFTIIIVGLTKSTPQVAIELTRADAFEYGLVNGYLTMDLLASFFFSSMIIQTLKSKFNSQKDTPSTHMELIKSSLLSFMIGGFLLALIYGLMAYISAAHSDGMTVGATEMLLGGLSLHLLGPKGAFLANSVASFSCLTTAIALTSASSHFLKKDILKTDKLSEPMAIGLVLAISIVLSNLEFAGIMKVLGPMVKICYPGMIALTVLSFFKSKIPNKIIQICVFATIGLKIIHFSFF